MASNKDTKEKDTTLSINDIEKVVSAIVTEQSQIQRHQILSIVTDLDKEKNRIMLLVGELKISLLKEMSERIKEEKKEILEQLHRGNDDLERLVNKSIAWREETSKTCKENYNKQIKDIKENHAIYVEAIDARLEKQKPNYYAIIPIVAILLSPAISFVSNLYAKLINHDNTMMAIEVQQKKIHKQQQKILDEITFLKKRKIISDSVKIKLPNLKLRQTRGDAQP